MEEQSSMWPGAPKAVWSVTLLPVMMMLASLASAHQPVLTYWLHSGRSPHSWWPVGMPGPSSVSSSISQKWVLNQPPRNHMGHPKQLAFFCPASAGQQAPVGALRACKVFTLLSSFSLITIELEPDILYIKRCSKWQLWWFMIKGIVTYLKLQSHACVR